MGVGGGVVAVAVAEGVIGVAEADGVMDAVADGKGVAGVCGTNVNSLVGFSVMVGNAVGVDVEAGVGCCLVDVGGTEVGGVRLGSRMTKSETIS